jgi:hypothetical protein
MCCRFFVSPILACAAVLLCVATGDLDAIDTRLPETSETSLQYLSQCAISLVVIAVVFPWFLLPLVPILWTFIYTARYFRKCARELKRLDGGFCRGVGAIVSPVIPAFLFAGMSRSPYLSNIQASVQGLTTIRAFGRMSHYVNANFKFADVNTTTYLAFYTWCAGFLSDLFC